jgi:hypothetical protein
MAHELPSLRAVHPLGRDRCLSAGGDSVRWQVPRRSDGAGVPSLHRHHPAGPRASLPRTFCAPLLEQQSVRSPTSQSVEHSGNMGTLSRIQGTFSRFQGTFSRIQVTFSRIQRTFSEHSVNIQ